MTERELLNEVQNRLSGIIDLLDENDWNNSWLRSNFFDLGYLLTVVNPESIKSGTFINIDIKKVKKDE